MRQGDAIPETVAGRIRDLRIVQEIVDLLVRSDLVKLSLATERKAAGWGVMDADTRLSDTSDAMPKGANGGGRGAYSASILC